MEFNGSRTVHECSTSDDYINSDIPTIYSVTSLVVCVCFISVLIVMYVCIGKVIYKHFKCVRSLKQSVKWPSGTVADEDVNSKSLSLTDNSAVHTVYSEKGRLVINGVRSLRNMQN
jgi:hypothetical protein